MLNIAGVYGSFRRCGSTPSWAAIRLPVRGALREGGGDHCLSGRSEVHGKDPPQSDGSLCQASDGFHMWANNRLRNEIGKVRAGWPFKVWVSARPLGISL